MKAKQPYHSPQDHIIFYQTATAAGDVIDTKWAVDVGLSSNRESARKMLNRDVHAGILEVVRVNGHPTYTRCYRLKQNVTLHMAAKTIPDPESPKGELTDNYAYGHTQNTDFDKNNVTISIQKERWVCHHDKQEATTTQPPPSSIKCQCKGAYICDTCLHGRYAVTVFPASECLQLSRSGLPYERWARYGFLGDLMKDTPYCNMAFDALDNIPALMNHRLFFEFYDERNAYSREFSTRLVRNKRIDGDIYIQGIKVHFTRYESGFVIVQSDRTESPIPPEAVPLFMAAIRDNLPFDSPGISTWRIAGADIHFDHPTEEKGKRHIPLNYEGYHGRAYNRNVQGQRVFRVEFNINPGCTVSEYPTIVERARQMLLQVMGK